MQKEKSVLPVKCRKCDRLFDLWHDLRGESESSLSPDFSAEVYNALSHSLCWECRHMMVAIADDEEELVNYSNSLLDEE